MNIRFITLTPQMSDEFLHYFENDAFPKNDSRSSCYCLESHLPNENEITTVEKWREKAKELISKGIMNLTMEKVLSDAKEEGCSYVEGYPFVDRDLIWQYRGPVRLFEKFGFEMIEKKSWFYIMRKRL